MSLFTHIAAFVAGLYAGGIVMAALSLSKMEPPNE